MADNGNTLTTEDPELAELETLAELPAAERVRMHKEAIEAANALREQIAKFAKADKLAEDKHAEGFAEMVAEKLQELIDDVPEMVCDRLYQSSFMTDVEGEKTVTVVMVGGGSPKAKSGSGRVAEDDKPDGLSKKAWHQAVWMDTQWSASKIAKYCGTNSGHVSNSLNSLAEYQAFRTSKNGN